MAKKQSASLQPVEPLHRPCRCCHQPILQKATVCHHCGHFQNRFRDNINVFSLLILLVSVAQFVLATRERVDATEANKKAQLALEKVVEAQNITVVAQQDVVGIAKAVIEISEILPRSTGYGAGLSDSDRQKLKQYSDFLNKKISEINKRAYKQ